MTSISRSATTSNAGAMSAPAETERGITWFPSSKEVKISHVWAHLQGDEFSGPSRKELERVAKMGGHPSKISREDIEDYGQLGARENATKARLMKAYQSAATGRHNGLRALGKKLEQIVTWPFEALRQLFAVDTYGG